MNLDYVYNVDHVVQPGETQATFGMNTFLGGKGINQSIACAKAGAEVYHAGDTFTGYFLAGMIEGMPVAKILKMSAKASSIAVTRAGAVPSIPYRKEVEV